MRAPERVQGHRDILDPESSMDDVEVEQADQAVVIEEQVAAVIVAVDPGGRQRVDRGQRPGLQQPGMLPPQVVELSVERRDPGTSSSPGTTRLASPIRRAAAASMISPSRISSRARLSPTMRGSQTVAPMSGSSPYRVSSRPTLVPTAKIRKSQARASCRPAP
jgi:hypothetical protein